jgi:ATP-dependent Lhr-like helicase
MMGQSGMLPWGLLQTISVIELYLREKWIEPPDKKPLPYSLLLHQTLAILASRGEHSRDALAGRILALPPFNGGTAEGGGAVEKEDFSLLLRHLERCGIVQRTEEGNCILGLEGEHIVNRFSFYSVFPNEDEYRVTKEGRELGKVNFVPSPGSVIAVAGNSYLVIDIDGLRREIRVSETSHLGSGKLWRGGGGGIHPRVSAAMKGILEEECMPPYLTPSAAKALAAGRAKARALGLLEKPVLPVDGGFLIAPWLGSAGMRTLELLLKKPELKKTLGIKTLDWESALALRVETNTAEKDFTAGLAAACEKALGKALGAPALLPNPIPYTDKYDHLLPPALLAKQYAANMTSMDELRRFAESFKGA